MSIWCEAMSESRPNGATYHGMPAAMIPPSSDSM